MEGNSYEAHTHTNRLRFNSLLIDARLQQGDQSAPVVGPRNTKPVRLQPQFR
jgi:hypothetical protein